MVVYTITGLNAKGRALRVATENSAWKACLRFGEMEARHGRAYICGDDGREIDASELMIRAEVEDAKLTLMDRRTLMPGGATAEMVQNCRAHSVRLASAASRMTDLSMHPGGIRCYGARMGSARGNGGVAIQPFAPSHLISWRALKVRT